MAVVRRGIGVDCGDYYIGVNLGPSLEAQLGWILIECDYYIGVNIFFDQVF